jgi:hypothetical protein
MSAEDSNSDLVIQLPKLSRKPDIYASYPIWPYKQIFPPDCQSSMARDRRRRRRIEQITHPLSLSKSHTHFHWTNHIPTFIEQITCPLSLSKSHTRFHWANDIPTFIEQITYPRSLSKSHTYVHWANHIPTFIEQITHANKTLKKLYLRNQTLWGVRCCFASGTPMGGYFFLPTDGGLNSETHNSETLFVCKTEIYLSTTQCKFKKI